MEEVWGGSTASLQSSARDGELGVPRQDSSPRTNNICVH